MNKLSIILSALVIGVTMTSGAALACHRNPIVGDINRNGLVNVADLNLLKASYGKPVSRCVTAKQFTCDLNGDGVVNVTDLSILLSHYKGGTNET